jgi:cysteine synthase
MTYQDLIATVGRTPLVELGRLAKSLPGRVLADKPLRNVKGRVAVSLVEDAELRGVLKRGMTVVEATAGNTGIGLPCVCDCRIDKRRQ